MTRVTMLAILSPLIAGLTVAGTFAASASTPPAPRAADLPRIVTAIPVAAKATTIPPTKPAVASVSRSTAVAVAKKKVTPPTPSAPSAPTGSSTKKASGGTTRSETADHKKSERDHEVVADSDVYDRDDEHSRSGKGHEKNNTDDD